MSGDLIVLVWIFRSGTRSQFPPLLMPIKRDLTISFMRGLLAVLRVGCVFAWQAAVTPRLAVRATPALRLDVPRAAPAMGMEYDKLREVVLPADNKDTFRNALGLQPFVWGLYTTLQPAQSASMFLGITVSGLSLTLFKGVAAMMIVTGAQMCRDEEPKAATTGLLLFAGWALLLRSALGAGTVGAAALSSVWWCTTMALVSARKLGFSTSGLLFVLSWGALLQTSLFAKVWALPLLPFLFSRVGGAPKPAAAKPAAAKPEATPSATKPEAKKSPPSPPSPPAPPGFTYDNFGVLIVA